MKNCLKHSILLSMSSMMVALLIAGCASAPTTARQTHTQQAEAQLERRLNEILDAAEKKDLERLDSYHLYGPKFTKFAASSASRLEATAGRKGEHDGLSAIQDLKMQAEEFKADVFGDVAIATFTLKSSFKIASDTIEKKEHGTLVFVKDRGSWKITHEYFSSIKASP